MARPSKSEQHARELYEASGKDLPDWDKLSTDEQEPWFAKATSDMEHPPVKPAEPPPKKASRTPEPTVIRDPLAAYTDAKGDIKIKVVAPGRYVITGFRTSSVFIPGVGTLAGPDQIDLPLTDETVPAVQAALDDFKLRRGAAPDA